MKRFFHILSYIRGYWRFGSLSVAFNILSVIFGLFSLTMIAPILDLIFRQNETEYAERLAKGIPQLKLSVDSAIEYFYYHLTKIIIDEGKIKALLLLCVLVVSLIFIKNFFRYIAMFFLANVRMGVVKDLRNEIYEKSLRLPLSYYSDQRKGDLMSRMTADVQEIEWSVMQSLEFLFRDPFSILFYLGTMFWISPKLTLFVFGLLIVPGFIIGKIAASLRKSSFKGKEKLGILFSLMEETLSGLRIIKAFNAEKSVSNKFKDENNLYTRITTWVYRKADLAGPLSEFLGVAIAAVLIYYGGCMVLDETLLPSEKITASVFITYIAIFSQVIAPAKALTTAYYNIQKGLASAERIEIILMAEENITDSPAAKSISSFEKEIEYKNVSFSYTRGDSGHVLKDINLKVPKGKTIALVGQSGSGKSTLADMLPRFYDADKGEILIDGISVRDLKITSLRDLMGIVSQESILFNDSVFNNIAFGLSNVKEADVINAAKIANAHDFIMQMPDGYQTNIGDRGSKMSGGQRQRIAIARAVLKNPPVLILDEATSALDSESERLVQDALNQLLKGRTSVVIAHRLSTIQHADEIIVLQRGEIAERGTHTELLAKNGVYKKLYDMQVFV